ncbi:MAG TPA: hypothetical protein H9979_05725, partial [Candidatus Megamonas gallistercoris]|nr:hypothetical protein [Candidatus Megamonas gallistercoris]
QMIIPNDRKNISRESKVLFAYPLASISAASVRFFAISVYNIVFPVIGDYHLSVFNGYTITAQSFVAKYV